VSEPLHRRIRVLVVDDDLLAAQGIAMMLGTTDDLEVVGIRSDGTQVQGAVAELHPDIVLCDVRMPRLDGVEVVRTLSGTPDAPRFIMMTAFDEDGRVLDAIAAGADAFIFKDDGPLQILDSIRQVGLGAAIFSRRAASQFADWVRGSGASDDPARRDARAKFALLTDTERKYALASTTGATDAELASEFYVAESTIKSAFSGIRTKWDVRNRTQIAVITTLATL
jgi:DNA-binding NarL/FixJ family response regulator